jgi:hypothetical protein
MSDTKEMINVEDDSSHSHEAPAAAENIDDEEKANISGEVIMRTTPNLQEGPASQVLSLFQTLTSMSGATIASQIGQNSGN